MKTLRLPDSMAVPSGHFSVDYAKMAVHPPVLQPDEAPFYEPTFERSDRDEVSSRHSRSSRQSKSSNKSSHSSLTELIDPKLIEEKNKLATSDQYGIHSA